MFHTQQTMNQILGLGTLGAKIGKDAIDQAKSAALMKSNAAKANDLKANAPDMLQLEQLQQHFQNIPENEYYSGTDAETMHKPYMDAITAARKWHSDLIEVEDTVENRVNQKDFEEKFGKDYGWMQGDIEMRTENDAYMARQHDLEDAEQAKYEQAMMKADAALNRETKQYQGQNANFQERLEQYRRMETDQMLTAKEILELGGKR